MEHTLIKNNEKCREADCEFCHRCTGREDLRQQASNAGVRVNTDLYGKEVENYYFYFLTNKAS